MLNLAPWTEYHITEATIHTTSSTSTNDIASIPDDVAPAADVKAADLERLPCLVRIGWLLGAQGVVTDLLDQTKDVFHKIFDAVFICTSKLSGDSVSDDSILGYMKSTWYKSLHQGMAENFLNT